MKWLVCETCGKTVGGLINNECEDCFEEILDKVENEVKEGEKHEA